MNFTDIFIGSAAIALGALIFAAGALNWQAAFHLPKAQSMEARFGRRGARVALAVLGLVLIGTGSAIIAGFAPFAPSS
jgi:hypothetical protein